MSSAAADRCALGRQIEPMGVTLPFEQIRLTRKHIQKTMNFAENCHNVAENCHKWEGKQHVFVFDQQAVDDERKKQDELQKCQESLKSSEDENTRLKKTLKRSKNRFDHEYQKLATENMNLKQIVNNSTPLESTVSADDGKSRYYLHLLLLYHVVCFNGIVRQRMALHYI